MVYNPSCPVVFPRSQVCIIEIIVSYISQKKIYAATRASNILSWGSIFVHVDPWSPPDGEPPRVCPWPGNVPAVGPVSCFSAFWSPCLSAPLIVCTCLPPLRNTNVGMAETRYVDATSFAASTSHFKKLTLGYCFARASNIGAIA